MVDSRRPYLTPARLSVNAFARPEERERLRPQKVGRDDIIDAAACPVTAHRVARGQGVVLPEAVSVDAKGLRMESVA